MKLIKKIFGIILILIGITPLINIITALVNGSFFKADPYESFGYIIMTISFITVGIFLLIQKQVKQDGCNTLN